MKKISSLLTNLLFTASIASVSAMDNNPQLSFPVNIQHEDLQQSNLQSSTFKQQENQENVEQLNETNRFLIRDYDLQVSNLQTLIEKIDKEQQTDPMTIDEALHQVKETLQTLIKNPQIVDQTLQIIRPVECLPNLTTSLNYTIDNINPCLKNQLTQQQAMDLIENLLKKQAQFLDKLNLKEEKNQQQIKILKNLNSRSFDKELYIFFVCCVIIKSIVGLF